MGGFPVVFIGYELAHDALEAYDSQNDRLRAIRALLRNIESETHIPPSLVRYDNDEKDVSHKYVDSGSHAYTSKELDYIPIPAEFARVPEWVKTSSDLGRVFAPNAPSGSNAKTRLKAN